MESSTPDGAAVTASGLSLRGPRGRVYEDVGFEAGAGSLVAVEGPAGSGRTCLLLTLAGRMRPTSGTAAVAGHPLPRRMAAVRRITALGPVSGVNDLDPALTVREHLRERTLLQRRFGEGLVAVPRPGRGRARRAADERQRTSRALDLAGLDLDTLAQGPRTQARDLDALDTLRLGLALAVLARPRLLCLDDVDRGLATADRETAWQALRTVAESGVTVVATCAEAPADAVPVRLRPATPQATDEATDETDDTADTADTADTKEEDTDARAGARRP